jgi:anti-sigma-K factor RskA
MNDIRHITHEDLTLYAMQALTPEEAEATRAHLQTCAECREELAVLNGDLALLALSVDQQPAPEGALDRILGKIHAGKTPAAEPAAHSDDIPAAKPEAPSDVAPSSVAPSNVVEMPNGRRVWPLLVPWLIAAVLGITCVLLGAKVVGLNESLSDEASLVSNLAAKASYAQQVLELLSAKNAQRVVLTAAKTPPAPMVHTIYLPERGALIMQANNLQPIPAGKAYELWVIPADGKAPIPAGMFQPDAHGYASVVLPKLPVGVPAKAFGITLESAGGSAVPTSPILLSGE